MNQKDSSAYRVADRLLTVSTLSGFESMIFSTSRDLANSDVMINKFGPVVLKIKLRPFARTLARLVKAERLDVKIVRYSDLKLFRSELKLSDVSGYPPAITPKLARALREGGRFPSLFAKPKRFTEEQEVRIALKLPFDVSDWTSVEATDLLPFVTRIS